MDAPGFEESDLVGLKYLDRLVPMLKQLHDVGCHWIVRATANSFSGSWLNSYPRKTPAQLRSKNLRRCGPRSAQRSNNNPL